MISSKMAFRVDANATIGTGHFMRCLTLADAMRDTCAGIAFVTRDLPSHLANMLVERGFEHLALPPVHGDYQASDELAHAAWLKTSQAHDAQQTLALLGNDPWLAMVIDHYALDHRYETAMRPWVRHIVVVDDLADRVHDCDVLLDQNHHPHPDKRYAGKVPSHCRLLLGPRYALLRSEFRTQRPMVKPREGNIRNVLVAFGGVDAQNLTGQVLASLSRRDLGVQVVAVIGEQHPQKQRIAQFCAAHGMACHIQTHDMAALMAQADLAIGAGGTAVWERLCMGLPMLCCATSNNQTQQLIDLEASGLAMVWNVDKPFDDVLHEINLHSAATVQRLHTQSKLGMALVDTLGAQRVVSTLKTLCVDIRLATTKDAENIYKWRNHPFVRNHSNDPREIGWDEHLRWIDKRLQSDLGPILIGEVGQQPIGVVRFDVDQHIAEVSIYLIPDSGLKGWGMPLLKQAECWLKKHFPQVVSLQANVRSNNNASQKLFEKMNYVVRQADEPIGFFKVLEALP